jgi:hypothetical protein
MKINSFVHNFMFLTTRICSVTNSIIILIIDKLFIDNLKEVAFTHTFNFYIFVFYPIKYQWIIKKSILFNLVIFEFQIVKHFVNIVFCKENKNLYSFSLPLILYKWINTDSKLNEVMELFLKSLWHILLKLVNTLLSNAWRKNFKQLKKLKN